MNLKEEELMTLREEVKHLTTLAESSKVSLAAVEKELEMIKLEKMHNEQRMNLERKRLEESENKCILAEKEAKRQSELSEKARESAASAEREKLEVERVAVERLGAIERLKSHIEDLARDKGALSAEVDKLRSSEQEAILKAASTEQRLEEREREMEELLQSAHEQRTNTVQVLESLLATERQARAEASARAEALSLQLQSTQGKLDVLQQELTTARLNETALETKMKAILAEQAGGTSRNKRPRVDELAQDMDLDVDNTPQRRRSTFMNSGNGASHPSAEENTPADSRESQDYLRFTVLKLKQELTAAGFAEELLQLRNPSKKDILNLYEKLVLKK
jgi:chromosome segregation ATPase